MSAMRPRAYPARWRRLRLESLEPRLLFAGDLAEGELYTPWHNHAEPADVDGSGEVTIADVLAVIQDLTRNGSRQVDPLSHPPHGMLVDVFPDNLVSPRDALDVLDALVVTRPEPPFVVHFPVNEATGSDVFSHVPQLVGQLEGGQRAMLACSNVALSGSRSVVSFDADHAGELRIEDARLNVDTAELSLELWMRPSDHLGRSGLVSKEDTERFGYPAGGYELTYLSDGTIEFRVSDGRPGGNGTGWRNWDVARSRTPLDPLQWHYIAATRRAVDDGFVMEIYVDGVLDGVASATKPIVHGNDQPLFVGGDITSKGVFVDPFHGLLHSVTVRHAGLTHDDVLSHYQFESCTRANRMYFSWRLEYDNTGDRPYHISPEVIQAVRDSPLDSFAPELARPFSSRAINYNALAEERLLAGQAATQQGTFFWPRIYLNRIVGCVPEADGLSGVRCAGPQFESRFQTAEDRAYFGALGEKGMGIWEEDELPGGALDRFYHEYFQTALQVAWDGKAPGIVIDLEKYNNYGLKGLVYLGTKDPQSPELNGVDINTLSPAEKSAIRDRVRDRLRDVGSKLADITEQTYPGAKLWVLNLTRNPWSESYIFEGLLRRAREQNYQLQVIEGGAVTVGYSHASAEHLNQQLDGQFSTFASTVGNQPQYELGKESIVLSAPVLLWESDQHASAGLKSDLLAYAAAQPGFEAEPETYVPETSTLAGFDAVLATLALRRPYTIVYAATGLREQVLGANGPTEFRDRSYDEYFSGDDSLLGDESVLLRKERFRDAIRDAWE